MLTINDIQNAIYQEGSIAFLNKVHDALTQIGKHDPFSAHLAEQMQEVILWQEDFSQFQDADLVA
jgi:hypothetical protein